MGYLCLECTNCLTATATLKELYWTNSMSSIPSTYVGSVDVHCTYLLYQVRLAELHYCHVVATCDHTVMVFHY